jgi:hypothetical protein
VVRAAATAGRGTTAVRGTATAVRRATAAMISRQGMFAGWTVGRVADVAVRVVRLVRLEVVELLCPTRGQRSMIPVVRIIPVVNVAIKAVRAVEPRASSEEHPANKPVRPVVAVGGTVVWGVVEVPVRTHRRYSNVDGNLGRRQGCAA